MKRFLLTCAVLVLIASPASAYQLPSYTISEELQAIPAEETLASLTTRRGEMQSVIPLNVLENRRKDYKTRLSRSAQALAKEYDQLQQELVFWSYVADLKHSLIELHAPHATAAISKEADRMAKAIIQKIYDISQEYDITVTALFQNFLVNVGAKEKGHCYHYVIDLWKMLMKDAWSSFDIHWGEAWAGTFRENNALVITAKGQPFSTGIAIDVWRTAGKPFWRSVQKDRFPWIEAKEIYLGKESS